MTPREKQLYGFVFLLVLVLFASIGILCSVIHIYKWCKRECCEKEIVFIRNRSENKNHVI